MVEKLLLFKPALFGTWKEEIFVFEPYM